MNPFVKFTTIASNKPTGDDALLIGYRDFFEEKLPSGWQIIHMQNHVFPYNHNPRYSDNPGVRISFAGSQIDETGDREAFTLWLMPMPYRFWSVNGLICPALRVGITNTHDIYYVEHANIKTWPNWKDDVISFLKLRTTFHMLIG